MGIPWLQLVKYAPSILSMTNELLQKARKAESSSHAPPADRRQEPQELEPRIALLQHDLRKQAEALHELAKQMEGLTAAVGEARRSLRTALTLGGAALAAALVAFVVAVAR